MPLITPIHSSQARPTRWGLTNLAIMIWLLAQPLAAAAGSGPERYDTMVFVCRSVDPSGTPLNRRYSPHGPVVGVLKSNNVFYSRGWDLRRPVRGYVPIRLTTGKAANAAGTTSATSSTAEADGWVWKAYIACELQN